MGKSDKKKTKPDEFVDLESALTANLDVLYNTDFAEGEKQDEPEEASEQLELREEPLETEETAKAPSGEAVSFEIPYEEDAPEDIKEEDDDIYNDINSALASQIKAEIKREKRIKRLKKPRWWLLSLIPFIGIFVLLIRPLRRNCPKWFMILRTIIFVAFAVEVMGIVASDGKLLCFEGAAYARWRMEERTALGITGAVSAESAKKLTGTPTPTEVPFSLDEELLATKVNTLLIVADKEEKILLGYYKSCWEQAGTEEYSSAYRQAMSIADLYFDSGIDTIKDESIKNKILEWENKNQ